ncbi:hypothetical protein NQ156_06790 [Microbacterium sp. zg.Y625]|uniref:hypothetical protein n=1 Tax=Microbacterium jiangjiandongii TaxID=3049071 RepID=UPI00214C270A|nr:MULTISPECIES: hypothetical protein [unclassified Microbacterium]MCR2792768.1 hypothetical protein [Microbacterium sp. zg.Y625]WIM26745.1 hypothetical protein QNO14_06815 [Microbacterium sp. zg-Y625]
MPISQTPIDDGEEARQALRALAAATRSVDDPAQTYDVVENLVGGLKSLKQVLDQLSSAHTSAAASARTDDGDHWAGVEEAYAAANALERASTLVARAGMAVDRASQHSGRVVWDSAAAAVPVAEWIAPRINPHDSFQHTNSFASPGSGASVRRRTGLSL